MGNGIMDGILNLEMFKTGAKLNIYILAGLGLIYSFWTQGIFLRTFDIRLYGRYTDEMLTVATVKTYIITYLTTAVGLVWGLHNRELRFFKLWGCVKFFEVIINIASLISTIVDYYRHIVAYVSIIILLAFGFYVKMCVWNLYKTLSEENHNENSEEKNGIVITLPKYEEQVPAVHKTFFVN